MKSLRNPNRKPSHPGAILREDVLPALKMSQAEFAACLDVSRLTVSELLLEKRSLTPEMAMRLATVLRTTPESWLRMQETVDLWKLKQTPERFNALKPLDRKLLAAREE